MTRLVRKLLTLVGIKSITESKRAFIVERNGRWEAWTFSRGERVFVAQRQEEEELREWLSKEGWEVKDGR